MILPAIILCIMFVVFVVFLIWACRDQLKSGSPLHKPPKRYGGTRDASETD